MRDLHLGLQGIYCETAERAVRAAKLPIIAADELPAHVPREDGEGQPLRCGTVIENGRALERVQAAMAEIYQTAGIRPRRKEKAS